jgi:cytochrome P450
MSPSELREHDPVAAPPSDAFPLPRGRAARHYPPGPRSRFPGEPLFAFRRDALGYLTAAAREYGDVAHLRLGSKRIFLLNHPDYVKDVLVTHHRRFTGLAFEAGKRIIGEGLLSAQGEAHRRQRRLVQPAYHRERVAAYGATMVEHARRWGERQRDGDVVAIRGEMMRLTLGVIGETMFGTSDDSAAEEVRELIDAALALFGPITFAFARLVERLPTPAARRFGRARDRFDARVYRMLHERRASGADRGDLLSMLLLAQDAEGDGAGLSDGQVRDEVVTIFLAGHETTASALTWAWSLLAQHPAVEARMHAEVDAVLGGRVPTAADLPRLPYTSGVFAEALRLYPPAAMIFRRALEEHPVGEWVIPKDGTVILSQYVLHRDARFFPDPELFDPDRWRPGATAARPRYAYFPFGGGPRVCIGEGFALLEGTLVLATIAQRWRATLLDGARPPAIDPLRQTRPSDALRMRLTRRGTAP